MGVGGFRGKINSKHHFSKSTLITTARRHLERSQTTKRKCSRFTVGGSNTSTSRGHKRVASKTGGELSQEREGAPHIHTSREQKLCPAFNFLLVGGVCCSSADLQGLEGGKAGFIRPGPPASCTITLTPRWLRINSQRDLFLQKRFTTS